MGASTFYLIVAIAVCVIAFCAVVQLIRSL